MKNWKEPISLLEIEKLLARELRNPKKPVRILADMDFGYSNYQYLITYLKKLDKYKGNLEVIQKYKLSLIVSLTFALRLEKVENIGHEKIKNIIFQSLQHQFRFCINLFANVFDEYGLSKFGLHINTLDNLLSLIALHAGISKEAHNDFFHLLDDSLSYMDMKGFEDGFLWNLSPRMVQLYPRMQKIYQYINWETRIKVFQECRDMFIDVKIGKLPENKILEKYPYLSYDLIEGCFRWHKEYQEKSKQLKPVYS